MWLETTLSAVALLFSIVSLGLRLYTPTDLDQQRRELRRFSAELVDLDERVTTWQKRENVRRSRDRKAELTEEAATENVDPMIARTRKLNELRQRARLVRGAQ